MGAEVSVEAIEIAGPAAEAATAGAAGSRSSVNRVGSAAVPIRVYEPAPGDAQPWATLVWAHGGSFVRGTLDWPESDWVARSFAAEGIRVVAVEYVLAGKSVKAPAPSNDVAAALAWAGARFAGPLVAGGASAGGHLAVLAAIDQADLAARGRARHASNAAPEAAAVRAADALILEYPTLHRVQKSDRKLAKLASKLPETRRFKADRIAEMYDFYLGTSGPEANGLDGQPAPEPPVAGELPEERLAKLPRTIIVNAEADELRASGEQFADQLDAAGVHVTAKTERGTVHGYLNRPDESPAASAATIAHFVAELKEALGA